MREIIRLFACAICKALGGEKENIYAPVPIIKPYGTIDINEMSSIVLDTLEKLSYYDTEIRLPDLPDQLCKVYQLDEVKKFLHLDETNSIVYVPEEQDCDDFAAILFGKFAGLIWTNTHALNWFVDENNKFWFIEPQTDQISRSLFQWQGWSIRFLVGR